jgi:hypothetical protein
MAAGTAASATPATPTSPDGGSANANHNPLLTPDAAVAGAQALNDAAVAVDADDPMIVLSGPSQLKAAAESFGLMLDTLALSGDTLALALYAGDGPGDIDVLRRDGSSWPQQQTLVDRGTGTVALSGDTMLGPGSPVIGELLVFERGASGFEQTAKLTALDADQSLQVDGVAIDGDTLAVAASKMTVPASMGSYGETLGSVYVFVRDGHDWKVQAHLSGSHSIANDRFGGALALDGDTLIVGAPGEGTISGPAPCLHSIGCGPLTFFGAGAAYVFVRHEGQWSEQAYLQPDAGKLGQFGGSVDVSGNSAVIGAEHEAGESTGVADAQAPLEVGAAYVFTRAGGKWSRNARLIGQHSFADDRFGHDVAIDGPRIAIGAPSQQSAAVGIDGDESDKSSWESGAAYLFERTAAGWTQSAFIKAEHPDQSDYFGNLVALEGTTLVIGAGAAADGTALEVLEITPAQP